MKLRLLVLGLLAPLLLVAAKDKESGAWKEIVNKDGEFTVSMPGAAVTETESIRLPSGPVDLVKYTVERKKDETVYLVIYCELAESVFKKGTDDKRLNYARNRAVANTKGKLVSEKKIKLGTVVGRELRFEVEGKGFVRQRIYSAKEKLYQLLVAGPKDKTLSKDADRFLDSFKLKVSADKKE